MATGAPRVHNHPAAKNQPRRLPPVHRRASGSATTHRPDPSSHTRATTTAGRPRVGTTHRHTPREYAHSTTGGK